MGRGPCEHGRMARVGAVAKWRVMAALADHILCFDLHAILAMRLSLIVGQPHSSKGRANFAINPSGADFRRLCRPAWRSLGAGLSIFPDGGRHDLSGN